jgi:3-dehydroshikimate dehydratase
MILGGLVSVTFRALSPGEIVDLVVQAGLEGIEWGGDVHVPHGDVACAREVYQRTVDAGLTVCSYGSYYRAGTGEPPDFEAVIESALALNAPLVRVWAGRRGSADADAGYWKAVVEDSQRILGLAQEAGLGVAYEFHENTLTDTNASALRLLREVAGGEPNTEPAAGLSTYWQPSLDMDEPTRREGLRAVLPWLSYVHVPHRRGRVRMPLADGADLWPQRLEIVRESGRDHYALIEFVQDDAPEIFLQDAATLLEWLSA